MFNNIPAGMTALNPGISRLRQALDKQNIPPNQEEEYYQNKGMPVSKDLLTLIDMNRTLQQHMGQMQNNPNPPTVAQDLQNEMARRQSGIAQLPVQNVGSERAYAKGGIVAFNGVNGSAVKGSGVEDEIAELEKSIKSDDYIKQGGLGGSLGRMITSGTMPMGYAQRQQAERRLAQLKTAQPMFAGAPTTADTARVEKDYADHMMAGAPDKTMPPLPPPPSVYMKKKEEGLAATPEGQKIYSPSIAPAVAPSTAAAPATPDNFNETEGYFRDRFLHPEKQETAREKARAGLYAYEADMAKKYQDEKAKDEKQRKSDIWLTLASSLASGIGAKESSAAKFSSMAGNFASGLKDVNQKHREIQQGIIAGENKLREAAVLRQAGDFDSSQAAQFEAAKFLNTANIKKRELGQKDTELAQQLQIHREDMANRLKIAGMRPPRNPEEQYAAELMLKLAHAPEGPERDRIQAEFNRFSDATKQYALSLHSPTLATANIQAATKRFIEAQKAVDMALLSDPKYTKLSPEKKEEYREVMLQQRLGQGQDSGFSAVPR